MTDFGVFVLWLSLLQNCCKSAARMLDSRFAARLPARPPAPTLQDNCCKIAAWLLQGLLQGLLQDCCKSAARVFDSRLAASLLQDCPPARPRICFKISAARLLQGCCKNAAMFASRLVVRVLQGLPQDCCKSAPRLLQDLMQDLLGSFWNFPVASGSLLVIKFNCIVLSVLFLLRFGRPPGT